MVKQLFDIHAIGRVLLETLIQEISGLPAHKDIGGNGDFIFDDLDELLFTGDLERILSDQHLVHHDAQRPNVNFLIILFPLQNLWTNI